VVVAAGIAVLLLALTGGRAVLRTTVANVEEHFVIEPDEPGYVELVEATPTLLSLHTHNGALAGVAFMALTGIDAGGGVVLLRRGIEPAMGKWVFPGGYVDRGESTTEAAVRETREESHLEVETRSLLGVYSYPRSPNVIIVYVAEVVGGALAAGDESTEAGTFPLGRIPWDELAFPSTVEALREFERLYGQGQVC